jgi:hypothetical protein
MRRSNILAIFHFPNPTFHSLTDGTHLSSSFSPPQPYPFSLPSCHPSSPAGQPHDASPPERVELLLVVSAPPSRPAARGAPVPALGPAGSSGRRRKHAAPCARAPAVVATGGATPDQQPAAASSAVRRSELGAWACGRGPGASRAVRLRRKQLPAARSQSSDRPPPPAPCEKGFG